MRKELFTMKFDTSEFSTDKILRTIMIVEDISISELARRMGSTKQNLSLKLNKADFREKDLRKMADAMGYDVTITFKKRDGEEQ
jgi:transcriptional regulator with XRE-family HTH domain